MWTATASGDGTTPVYQFNVTSPNGSSQMVQDFSSSNTFNWDPLLEGTYSVQVVVKNSYSSTSVDSKTASYTAQTRVVGSSAVISPTANPLVALYSAPPSSGSSMYVQFSPLSPTPSWTDTSQLPVVSGKSTNFLVAGMLPNTTYLMRDVLNDGTVSAPLAYTTGSLPSNLSFPTFTVPQSPGPGTDLTQSMILHEGIGPTTTMQVLTTDLAGNINWYYDTVAANFPAIGTTIVPGGTLLLVGGNLSNFAGGDTLREIDLGGNVVRQTDIYTVNAQLAAMGQSPIIDFDHDAERLPNGDTAVIALTQKVINVNGVPTTYNGNMILVLNQNFQVSWAWNAFNYLSTSRLGTDGEGPSDFLHANSVAWSPADGDLIVSLRAQDWVLKLNYANGSGDGHIVWTLGAGGNFTAIAPPGVTYPWFTHQHDVTYVDNSTILVFDDGNTRRLTDPNADSRGQEWVLDEQAMTATLVVNADLGNYSLALGSAQLLPNGSLDFNSGYLGQPNFYGQSIEVLPNGTITYVQQMNGAGPEYRSYFMNNLYGTPASVLNQGFEDPILGTGGTAYQYDPTGTAWSYSGTAGVAGNGSAFTSGNPNAPQGTQVAFLQETGTTTQTVDFTVAGTYQISLGAAQRANYGTSNEEIQVEVDGSVVATITPAGTTYSTYSTYTTSPFTASAGNHTITLVGVDPSGKDYTAFVDQVNVNNVAATGVTTPSAAFGDAGLESPSVGTGSSAYRYDPAGTAWTFTNQAGVAGNGSAFTSGNPNAPQGTQVAFIQQTGSISQTVNFATAGSYLISLSAAQRANYGTSNESVQVLVDGTPLSTFTPASTSYSTYITVPFNVTAGNHTITFAGGAPTGADYTAFLDQININNVAPAGFTDPSFENPSLGSGTSAYQYDPTGTAWSYYGGAGVAGNGSSFTAGNPNAPQGTQVAFIQETGSISQSVNFASTGSYQISFSAAQRANYGTSNEQVQVLVDGTVVSTITPASTNYSIYTTAAFNVTAGSHTITFAGVDPSGKDYSAFIDASVILQVG